MKKNYCTTIKTVLLSLSLVFSLSGCEPGSGGPSLPTRKKMPALTIDDENFEGTPAFEQAPASQIEGQYAFATQNVDLAIGGVTQRFVSISLPDASTDSATVKLLESLKPFASTLLSGWAMQQRHGVAIDLSAHNGETIHRSDFILEQPNGFNIPLVITWDRLSEYRLNTIKQLVAQVPSLKLNVVSNN